LKKGETAGRGTNQMDKGVPRKRKDLWGKGGRSKSTEGSKSLDRLNGSEEKIWGPAVGVQEIPKNDKGGPHFGRKKKEEANIILTRDMVNSFGKNR